MLRNKTHNIEFDMSQGKYIYKLHEATKFWVTSLFAVTDYGLRHFLYCTKNPLHLTCHLVST